MGAKQLGFGDYEQSTAKKQTKREKFLSEMDKVVPWQLLIDLIEPYYPKTGSKEGRPPYPLATMLRIYLMQQWYSLSDPAMEDALIEVPVMRRFAGIDMMSERIPDETTILAFRHLLEKHDLGRRIFEAVKAHLKACGMAMKQGTIIDATLIAGRFAREMDALIWPQSEFGYKEGGGKKKEKAIFLLCAKIIILIRASHGFQSKHLTGPNLQSKHLTSPHQEKGK